MFIYYCFNENFVVVQSISFCFSFILATNVTSSIVRPVANVTTSMVRPVTNVRPTFTFTPLNAQYANPSAQLAAISKMASAGLSLPMPAFQMQSMTKGMPVTQQPMLVSTNPTTCMPQSQPVATSLIPTIHANPMSMTTGSVSSIKTTQSAPMTGLTQPTQTVAPMANMRSVFTPHLMAGHIPLNALLAQTIPRTTLGSILSTVTSPSPVLTTTANQGSSSLQLMSLAQMTPGTQLLSPMSPALQLGAPGLTQAQLSQMLLKQIPIFTPGLLQAGQVQSMIPSVVKPLVVVSVPSVVTTTNISTTTTVTKPSTTS